MKKDFNERYEGIIRKNFYEGFNALTGELPIVEYNLKNEIENFILREKLYDYAEIITMACFRAQIYGFDNLKSEFSRQLMRLNTNLNRLNTRYENHEFLELLNMKVFALLNSLITYY